MAGLKLLFCICLLSLRLVLWSQDCINPPFAKYLVQKKYIVLGTILKIDKYSFSIAADTWLKPEIKQTKRLVVRFSLRFNDAEEKKQALRLEEGERYAFLLSYKRHGIRHCVLRENCRFKIVGDSLCLGEKFVQGVPIANTALLRAENHYNDKLVETGYMISVNDFSNMVREVNNAIQADGESMTFHYFGTKSENPFTIAVIEEFVACYAKQLSKKPVNYSD